MHTNATSQARSLPVTVVGTERLRDSTAFALSVVLVLAASFRGFINLIPSAGVEVATLGSDLAVAAMAAILLIRLPHLGRVESWMLFMGLTFLVCLALLAAGPEPIDVALLAIRSLLFYPIAAIFGAFLVRKQRTALKIVDLVMYSGLAIMVFGCLQYVYRSSLPSWLLFPSDTYLFGYYGTDITRSTGLVGNSIVYGTYGLLILALWLARACWKPSLITLLACGLSLGGVLVSFSRVSIAAGVGLAIAAAIVYMTRGRGSGAAVRVVAGVAVLAVAVLVAASFGWLDAVAGSFIVDGLMNSSNLTAAESAAGHEAFADAAMSIFQSHPVFGVGLGTQSVFSENARSSRIITDGFYYSNLVEGGLFLGVPLVCFLGSAAFGAIRSVKPLRGEGWIAAGLVGYMATQLLLAGFYNTGFFGKVPQVAFWVTFGAMIALGRIASHEEASMAP